ncbi:hypothetical protein SAMN04515665_12676 [Blastococcus sp. DSM 46786]|uniref:hypothetical protein n=1 Tax=Blastococcus sp. DSM 46786 TaxID=1798227 RepID=UPI0008D8B20D|nr:hypothetical protein [Blastococcus sp. DSM 46786]SEM02603.1 hypothetical protein SAMN04515665_12676 [Blastococcus sp. DSM 46786]
MTTDGDGRTAPEAEVRGAEVRGAEVRGAEVPEAEVRGAEVPEAEVRAAAERWARAAGLPTSVLDEPAPATPSTTARLVRGLLLGAAVGAVLVLSASQGLTAALWGLIALLVGLLVGRIAQDRRRPVPRAVPRRL